MKPIIPQYIVKKRIEKLTNLAENNKNLYIKNFEDVTVKAIVEKVVFLAQTFRKSKTEIDSLLRKESTEIEIIDF